MPTPVPDKVTEAWLLGKAEAWMNRYSDFPKEARDRAARLLYEHLSEAQVAQLQSRGSYLRVGEYKILVNYGSWPRVFGPTGDSCMSFGGDNGRAHINLPTCDYLLSLKLALETGQVRNLSEVSSGHPLLKGT